MVAFPCNQFGQQEPGSAEEILAFVAKYGATFYEGFRMFYLSCAEAFAANHGNEYMCGWYLFEKRA